MRLRKNGDPDNYSTTPEWAWLPASPGEDHYDVKLTAHQGNGLKGPLFAITRRMMDEDGTSIIARTYEWYLKYDDPFYIPKWDAPDDPNVGVFGYFDSDEQVLSATPPEGLTGTGLGLTVMQLCVSDYYGACDPATVTQHPRAYFYGTWGRSPGLGLNGIKFEH